MNSLITITIKLNTVDANIDEVVDADDGRHQCIIRRNPRSQVNARAASMAVDSLQYLISIRSDYPAKE